MIHGSRRVLWCGHTLECVLHEAVRASSVCYCCTVAGSFFWPLHRASPTNKIIDQPDMPLKYALTNPCGCLMHSFPDYRCSTLAITSNECGCVTLHSQAILVSAINTCIKVCSKLTSSTFYVCFATWWWAQRSWDTTDNALLPPWHHHT